MPAVDKLNNLYRQAEKAVDKAVDKEQIEQIRVKYLGRKGEITSILRGLSDLDPKERPAVGKLANELKNKLEAAINDKLKSLKAKPPAIEALDVSLPGKKPNYGKKHLVTQIIDEAIQIFLGLGYRVAEGPEVETDFYNFTALNTPEDHPARSLQDTFYIRGLTDPDREGEPVLLRTHTSPVQIRVMEKQKPPIYILAPGKAYRRDVADPSHVPMFHQIEGLAIDKKITFGDLRGTLEIFVKELFGEDRAIRMRPHYFPFTEPSAEVDVSCGLCKGSGCRLCSGTGWLEILGCGMVDPNVLKYGGIDSDMYTGFAFGMGVERVAVLKYGLDDIRMLYDNDQRFLEQF
ncbi:MAG: phenylalanine--tRNA ligase subunit alpha [Actinobacteria bacterium]|nr:MAG: phenylalanine--tRNA ligase subunit alpha [Actinomycetota bacterium]